MCLLVADMFIAKDGIEIAVNGRAKSILDEKAASPV
jgi:hypothetical protein